MLIIKPIIIDSKTVVLDLNNKYDVDIPKKELPHSERISDVILKLFTFVICDFPPY